MLLHIVLKELCKFPMEIEEKKSNLISSFSELLGESIYMPPKWSAKSHTGAIEKQNFIKSINWKVHYYSLYYKTVLPQDLARLSAGLYYHSIFLLLQLYIHT